MNIRNIIDTLAKYNYNYANSSNPQYLFFCKNSGEDFSAIVLINDIKYPQSADSLIFASIRDSLEKTLLLRGYKSVDILFVIFTKNPFSYKKLADSDFKFWISDMNENRIISYCPEDSSFDFIRDDFEKSLTEEHENVSFLQKLKSLVNSAFPICTLIFALINILVFLYMEFFGNLYDISYIYDHGATEWRSVLNNHEYYRLLTGTFIHFDFSHLFNNMMSLIIIGSQLEPAMGHIKYFVTYILSGIAGSITSVIYNSMQSSYVISAGASGAIFGLFGAYAVCALFDIVKHRQVSFSRIAIISLLMVYNGTIDSSVDNAAHLGGMIFGALIAFICCICRKNKI